MYVRVFVETQYTHKTGFPERLQQYFRINQRGKTTDFVARKRVADKRNVCTVRSSLGHKFTPFRCLGRWLGGRTRAGPGRREK